MTISVEFVMMFVPVFVNRAYFERYKKKELEANNDAGENELLTNRIEMSKSIDNRQVVENAMRKNH